MLVYRADLEAKWDAEDRAAEEARAKQRRKRRQRRDREQSTKDVERQQLPDYVQQPIAYIEQAGVPSTYVDEVSRALQDLFHLTRTLKEKRRREIMIVFTAEITNGYSEKSGPAFEEEHIDLMRRLQNRIDGMHEETGKISGMLTTMVIKDNQQKRRATYGTKRD